MLELYTVLFTKTDKTQWEWQCAAKSRDDAIWQFHHATVDVAEQLGIETIDYIGPERLAPQESEGDNVSLS